jgi:predicted O-methyltransferase YrrM
VAVVGPRETTTDCDIKTYDVFKQNLDDLLQTGTVIAHRSKFVEGLFSAKSIDMVFIDGDHTGKAVLDDIQVALKVLKPGGLLCGHDYDVVSIAVHNSLTGVQRMRPPKSGSIWWTNDTQS